LEESDWAVTTARDGLEGLRLGQEEPFDVIIVDRMLPHIDGLSLVGALRAQNIQTPVLFVTAMGSVSDRVAGLEGGGDDYLVKPFSFEELRARLRILARRSRSEDTDLKVLRAGGLSLDRLTRTAVRGGRTIDLLPLEFKLLEFLLLHVGEVVTRSMLLEKVWGFKFDPRTNIVETHISRLRAKIDADGAPPLITTIRGSGYIVAAP
jgi:two-component system OmpR family response regulator